MDSCAHSFGCACEGVRGAEQVEAMRGKVVDGWRETKRVEGGREEGGGRAAGSVSDGARQQNDNSPWKPFM